MSREASEFQYKAMSLAFRGKEIFKPLNTGWIDEHVACVREYVANIFFYTKDGATIMIDAGYSYPRLQEKMGWLGIEPSDIKHILITHQDTDHVGAVEQDSDGLFSQATLYLSDIENRYLTGEVRRNVYWGLYKLPQVTTDNKKVLLDDEEVRYLDGIKVESLMVPGHTWGHMVYLVDDSYLFTGDAIWFGPDGGCSFLDALAEDNRLALSSLADLRAILRNRGIAPKVITGHTGWTSDFDFAFAHTDEVCHALFKQRPHDPKAPYDAFNEDDDTAEAARATRLSEVEPVTVLGRNKGFWNRTAFAYDAATRAGEGGLQEAASYVASFARKTDVVLDVACGTGTFACAVAPAAGFVAACDFAPNMVRRTQKKMIKLGLENVACGVGDLLDLNFADESFDLTIAGNVLHLLNDPRRAVRELVRVTLRKGIIAIPNYVNAESLDRRFLHLIEVAGFAVQHEWDEQSFLAFLEKTGLEVIEHRSFAARQPLCVAICRIGAE